MRAEPDARSGPTDASVTRAQPDVPSGSPDALATGLDPGAGTEPASEAALGATLGAALDRAGRVLVAPDLSVPEHPEIFVAGDMVAVACNGSARAEEPQALMVSARPVGRSV